jgi:hypothetical protein
MMVFTADSPHELLNSPCHNVGVGVYKKNVFGSGGFDF